MAEGAPLRAYLLYLVVINMSGALTYNITHEPQHTSSNYRHSHSAISKDTPLSRILIPKHDNKHNELYESQTTNNQRGKRDTQPLSQSESAGRERHGRRHSSDPHRMYQTLYDRQYAENCTKPSKSGYAKIYLEANHLPRYECPDGQWACPKPHRAKHVTCINESQVCDLHLDCPKAEDEDRLFCSVYRENRQLKEEHKVLQQSINELLNIMKRQNQTNTVQTCKIDNLNTRLMNHHHQENSITKKDDVHVVPGITRSCHAGLS